MFDFAPVWVKLERDLHSVYSLKNTNVCHSYCCPLLAASVIQMLVHASAPPAGFPHVLTLPSFPTGMDVVKIGGPVYRIGVGGGAASSVQVSGTSSGAESLMLLGPGPRWPVNSQSPLAQLCHLLPQVQGDNASELDFGAVQRGDPEMEQKMNRVIRACVEASRGNPICSLHDQGAGGNGEDRDWDEGSGLLPGSTEAEASRVYKRPPGPGSHSLPPRTFRRGLALGGAGARHHGMVVGGVQPQFCRVHRIRGSFGGRG